MKTKVMSGVMLATLLFWLALFLGCGGGSNKSSSSGTSGGSTGGTSGNTVAGGGSGDGSGGGGGTGGGGGSGGGTGGTGGSGGGAGGTTPTVSAYVGAQSSGNAWAATITNSTSFSLTNTTTGVSYTGALAPLSTTGFSAISGTNGFVLEVPGVVAVVSRDGDPYPIFMVPAPSSCPVVSTNSASPTALNLVSLGGSGWDSLSIWSSSGYDVSLISDNWSNTAATTSTVGTCSNNVISTAGFGSLILAPIEITVQPMLAILNGGVGGDVEVGGTPLSSSTLGNVARNGYIGVLSTAGSINMVGLDFAGVTFGTIAGTPTVSGVLEGGRFDASAQTHGSEITIGFVTSAVTSQATLGDQTAGVNSLTMQVVPLYAGQYFIFGISETNNRPYVILLVQK